MNKVCRLAPEVSHLLFADAFFLFCWATTDECIRLKKVLDDYERALGQAINYSKLGIYFSKNVGDDVKGHIATILGVRSTLNIGRYLGLPSLVGRNKRKPFVILKIVYGRNFRIGEDVNCQRLIKKSLLNQLPNLFLLFA